MKSFTFAIAVFSLCGMLALSGCGYTFAGRKGLMVASVGIGPIKNESMEPGLSEMLYSALSDELMKQGINVDQNSPNRISGNLTLFDLSGVSEANDSFTAYQVTISGRFVFRGANGKEVLLPGSTPFILTFSSQGALNQVFAQRQLAVEAGMQNLASQIVSGLLVPLK
ncbi:MAG: LPS assembly lipoprotein LptE [Nitrospiraceae bacterium]|nr:LPS assembly lipoprotein LptE [Nitrospiraceae bacterium]MDA8325904.1 LPS assembly lipoprotein LptE [Nitrospiraceae bacterium]